MFTQLTQFVYEDAARRNASPAVVIGLYSGMVIYFLLFTLFWMGVLSGKDIIQYISSDTNEVAKYFGLLIYLTVGGATAWAYSELTVNLTSSIFGMFTSKLVQLKGSTLSLAVGLAILLILIVGLGPYVMLVGLVSLRHSLQETLPIDGVGLTVGGVLITLLTIVVPGLLSDSTTSQQKKAMVLTDLLIAAGESAEDAVRANPMLALQMVEALTVPDGWRVVDPNGAAALPSPYNVQAMRRLGQGATVAMHPGVNPPMMVYVPKSGDPPAQQVNAELVDDAK